MVVSRVRKTHFPKGVLTSSDTRAIILGGIHFGRIHSLKHTHVDISLAEGLGHDAT